MKKVKTNNPDYYLNKEISIELVIRRLKTALMIDKDVELSDLLGFKNRNQVTMFKIRNNITATGWNRIFLLLNRPEYRFIDMNALFKDIGKVKSETE